MPTYKHIKSLLKNPSKKAEAQLRLQGVPYVNIQDQAGNTFQVLSDKSGTLTTIEQDINQACNTTRATTGCADPMTSLMDTGLEGCDYQERPHHTPPPAREFLRAKAELGDVVPNSRVQLFACGNQTDTANQAAICVKSAIKAGCAPSTAVDWTGTIVIGSVAGAVALLGGALCFWRCRRRGSSAQLSDNYQEMDRNPAVRISSF